MLSTSYEQLINKAKIGSYEYVDFNEIVELALNEDIQSSQEDQKRVLFLGIDVQNDFMQEGALGVPGAHADVERITKFIYNHINEITEIAVSLDTHELDQIFHPSWWIDAEGKNPEPFTIITSKDVEEGKWRPLYAPEISVDYVKQLEIFGQKELCIWPFHCIAGTPGATLESQFSRMAHFHSAVRNTSVKKIVKGQDPYSEMYGIIKPEYSRDDQTNRELLAYIREFDEIYIAGQAESHCVYETVRQIAEHFADDLKWTQNIYVLKDGMSCIPGFEEENAKSWQSLTEKYGVQLVESSKITAS